METFILKDLGKIVTGKTPETNKPEYFNGDLPFITPSDIKTYDVRYVDETERTLSTYGGNRINACQLPVNSICFVCIGSTIGKMCMTKCKSYTNQQINSIVPYKTCNVFYLFYFLRYIRGYFQSIGGATGSGKGIINKTLFEKTKISIHGNLVIQERIASILSTYDDLIENNNRRIRILEQMAENLYKEWFVRFRFPGHSRGETKQVKPKGWVLSSNSAYIECPKSWGFNEFIKIGKFVRGKNITADNMITGEIPVISAGIEPSGYHNACNVNGQSITISASGANAGYLKYHQISIWAADCSYCQDSNKLWFLYHSLKFLQPVISNMQTGAAQPHVYPKHINKLYTIIPDEEILLKFQEVVSPIYDSIKLLREKNTNLTKQRDLLLPRLMSGKLKV